MYIRSKQALERYIFKIKVVIAVHVSAIHESFHYQRQARLATMSARLCARCRNPD